MSENGSHARLAFVILSSVVLIVLAINSVFYGLQAAATEKAVIRAEALEYRVRANERELSSISAKLDAILQAQQRMERALQLKP